MDSHWYCCCFTYAEFQNLLVEGEPGDWELLQEQENEAKPSQWKESVKENHVG